MKPCLHDHFRNPPAWFLGLLMTIFLLLLATSLYWRDFVWQNIVLPTVDFNSRGIQVFHFPEMHTKSLSDGRKLFPTSSFTVERQYSSAMGAGVIKLDKPQVFQFMLETDDYGNFSVDWKKRIDQGPATSALNRSRVKKWMDTGLHLVLVELNNRSGKGWLKLMIREEHGQPWLLLGEKMPIYPVKLSIFPNWWRSIPYVKWGCTLALSLMLLAFMYFYRRWEPLRRFYAFFPKMEKRFCSSGFLDSPKLQTFIFLVPVVLFTTLLAIKLNDQELFRRMAWDDSILEYMQFGFYLLASFISFGIMLKSMRYRLFQHSIAFGLLFLALLFVSMEEISWGQRIFQIQSPEYFQAHNKQREITLHNLNVVAPYLHDAYIAVGLYGMLAWLVIPRLKLKRSNILNYCVPGWYLSSAFFFLFAVYKIYTYVIPHGSELLGIDQEQFWQNWHLYDQEAVEFLLSLAVKTFVIISYYKVGKLCLETGAKKTEPAT